MAGDRKNFVDRALLRWLSLIQSHFLMLHLILALAFLSASHVLFLALELKPNLAQSIGTEVAISIGSVSVPFLVTFAALRREIMTIVRLPGIGPPVATEVVLRVLSDHLNRAANVLEDLKTEGLPLAAENVLEWSRRCFEMANSSYIGTDGNVPSKYMKLYPDYLEAHRTYLRRTNSPESTRVIIADKTALLEDHRENPSAYAQFVQWHADNGVRLLSLPRATASVLAAAHETRGITDIAFWEGEFAISWKYENERESIILRLLFVGERRYESWRSFMLAVVDAATPFPDAE